MNIVAVAAHGRNGALLGYADSDTPRDDGVRTGFGASTVELSAPGEAIVVATTRGRSERVAGTSYAAALVSAALAAAMSIEPEATPERLLELVTARPPIESLQGLVSRGAVRLPGL